MGALLLIVGIAIDPLSQQLVSYEQQHISTDDLTASITTVEGWADGTDQNGIYVLGSDPIDKDDREYYSTISTGMKGAVQTGLYSANNTVLDLEPDCPPSSGNCTFPPYSSLAVCTSFADVSSSLVWRNLSKNVETTHTREYVAANQFLVLNYNGIREGFMNVSSAAVTAVDNALVFNNSVAYKSSKVPLTDFFVIYANGTDAHYGTTYAAIEVLLEWCVQNYTSNVTNGTASTRRGDAERNFTTQGGSYPITGQPSQEFGRSQYRIDSTAHYSLQRYFRNLLQGFVARDWDQYWVSSTDVAQTLYEPFNKFQGDISHLTDDLKDGIRNTGRVGLELMMNNVATSMTNYIRGQADSMAPGTAGVDRIGGTVLVQQTVVAIRWNWIAAHVVFAALSILLLVVTVAVQVFSPLRGTPWKSSSLAVLHTLDPSLLK